MKSYLLFYRGTGIVAWFIRFWTKSKYSHVAPAVFVSGKTDAMYAYDAYWSTGVTRRLVTPAYPADLVQAIPAEQWATWGKLNWLEAQVGKPYDRWSIIFIGITKRSPKWLHIYISRQGEWICSRLACVFAGYEQLAWGLTWPPSPEDIFEFGRKT